MCVLDIELPFSSLHLPRLSPSRGSTAALPRTKPELEETQPIFPGALEMGKCCRNSAETRCEQPSRINTQVLGCSPGGKGAEPSVPACSGRLGFLSWCCWRWKSWKTGKSGRDGEKSNDLELSRQLQSSPSGFFALGFPVQPVRSVLRFYWRLV